jgi:hypothetical protein
MQSAYSVAAYYTHKYSLFVFPSPPSALQPALYYLSLRMAAIADLPLSFYYLSREKCVPGSVYTTPLSGCTYNLLKMSSFRFLGVISAKSDDLNIFIAF